MENLAKGDWTDPERVKHFPKTYQVRYGDMFWNTFNKLIENKTRDVIADFGCGPGLWLLDAATRFNSTRLHGLELIDLDKDRIAITHNTLDLAFSGYNLFLTY